ncbi:hypothetical protein J6590_009008 [Homalodisca vitripennis]|nr:hypothetical protein J6590_009008 [Homalodisca vitripennis]
MSNLLKPLDGGEKQTINITADNEVAPRFLGLLSGVVNMIASPFKHAFMPRYPPPCTSPAPRPPNIIHRTPPPPTQKPTSPAPPSQQPINIIVNIPKDVDVDYYY